MSCHTMSCHPYHAHLAIVKRRKLNLKEKVESSFMRTLFQTLRSRRFQRGLDRVNLHRPTVAQRSIISWFQKHGSRRFRCCRPSRGARRGAWTSGRPRCAVRCDGGGGGAVVSVERPCRASRCRVKRVEKRRGEEKRDVRDVRLAAAVGAHRHISLVLMPPEPSKSDLRNRFWRSRSLRACAASPPPPAQPHPLIETAPPEPSFGFRLVGRACVAPMAEMRGGGVPRGTSDGPCAGERWA